PDGYEFGSNLPATVSAAQRRWETMRQVLQPRSTLGILLVPNGADHHAPQRNADAAITALTRAAAPLKVELGGLTRLAELLATRAAQSTLPQVEGELRDSYGYTWTLAGTLASRTHQKRANARVERELLRDVEPWTALARLRGASSTRHHVNTAWETLLACHPHDSLCGCSIDAVAEAVDTRLAQATALAGELRDGSLSALLGHDANSARSKADDWSSAVIVRNRAPRSRSGVAEIELDVPLAHVPVGPGSAGRSRPLPTREALPVPTQLLSYERRFARIEAASFYPINYEVERRRCLVWLPTVPGYGIVALPVTESGLGTSGTGALSVTADARSVRGQLGALTSTRGGLTLRRAGSVANAKPLFQLQIERDGGDLYTASPVPGTRGSAKPRSSRVSLRGPLRAAIDNTWRATTAGRGPRASVDVRTHTALDAGANFVRVSVSGVNDAVDHRLRIVFQTGVRPRHVIADAAFALVERKPLRVPAAERRAETPPPTAPLHRFVSLFNGTRGCTVVSDGLAEYEVLDTGAVAITLVRAVGQLSRDDIPQRPGHAGWPEATPRAQCNGLFAAQFAVAWHAGDDATTRAQILALVDDVLLPLTGATRHDLVALPEPIDGVALEGAGLEFSTVKESEDGRGLIARCVNVTNAEVRGAWVLPRDIAVAHTARLDETPLDPLKVRGRRIEIVVPPNGISTVRIGLDRDRAR
ncbi:MAG: glycosyl hydrolase-related protein, partial [Gemmatimonadaceae bacterium]